MWRLLYPLRYFALINSEKRHIDLWPTLLLTAMISSPFLLLSKATFFGEGGFLDKLLLLTSALTGFYVAALVAAATFPHEDLDKPITVGAIRIKTRDGDGKPDIVHLTRREFTTTVFGYLAFNAFMLSIASGMFITLSVADFVPLSHLRWIGSAFTHDALRYWRAGLLVAMSAVVAHLTVATCLGLYYLMGRLYYREPKVISKKQDRQAA